MKRIAWWWTVTGYEADFMKKDDRGKSLSGAEMVETVCRSLFHKTAPYSNLAQLSWDKVDFLNTWFTLDHHTGPNNVFCSFCGQEYVPDPEAKFMMHFLLDHCRSLLATDREFSPIGSGIATPT